MTSWFHVLVSILPRQTCTRGGVNVLQGLELLADVGPEEGREEHAHAETRELLGRVGVQEIEHDARCRPVVAPADDHASQTTTTLFDTRLNAAAEPVVSHHWEC